MKKNGRYIGYDILRTIAIMLVPFIHSYTYLGSLSANRLSPKWIVLLALYYISLICVPLFMMLSGALMRKKEFSAKYYCGIFKIIVPYVAVSIITMAVKNIAGSADYGIISGTLAILDFSAIGYAWYVEMYLGLYLIIPFINMVLQKITRRSHLILLGIMVLLTMVPEFLKGFHGKLDIVPDWWTDLFPITYYLAGAYFAEYKPKIKKTLSAAGLIVSIAIPTAVNCYYTAKTGAYAWFVMNQNYSLSTFMIAAFTWLLLYDVRSLPRPLSAVFTRISLFSFEMYLTSYICDSFLYRYTSEITAYTSKIHLPNCFVMPAAVLICAFASAFVIRLVTVPLSRILTDLCCRLTEAKAPSNEEKA